MSDPATGQEASAVVQLLLHSRSQVWGKYGSLSVVFPFIFIRLLLFLRQGLSMCPSCPGTHYIDQAGLELIKICLSMSPPSAGVKGMLALSFTLTTNVVRAGEVT